VTYGPIWGAASDSIDITWFSFFGGGARFVKTREELTAEELAIVAGMATIPADDDICVEDAGEARVVVYSNSVPDLYYASQYDGSCGRAVRLVAYEPVHALLELVGCKTAKAYDGSTLETAASITPNDGCYHGIFNSSDATPKWWFVLVVPTAGTLSVMLDSCGDRDLELTLFDETGETALATTTSAMNAAGAECPELTLDVEPGNYAVYVDMRGGTYAGDFYIRTESH
jgi:hypothetical protein